MTADELKSATADLDPKTRDKVRGAFAAVEREREFLRELLTRDQETPALPGAAPTMLAAYFVLRELATRVSTACRAPSSEPPRDPLAAWILTHLSHPLSLFFRDGPDGSQGLYDFWRLTVQIVEHERRARR